ncbi:MAG: hypothetical protein L3J82_00765 [Planctomycetes bacterium]|nr:hypothetical protein [Planctomycetota bacterium]
MSSNYSSDTNHSKDNGSINPPEVISNKETPKPFSLNPDRNGTSTTNTSAVKPIPDGHWRLTGQLVAAFEVNYSVLTDVDLEEWFLSMETLPANDGKTSSERADIELAPDGRFIVDVPEEELTSISGAWRFDLDIEQENHPLEGWGGGYDFGEWKNDGGIVDMSAVHNLIKPIVSGRQADFGIIKINLNSIDPNALFVSGRVMHTSGVPFANARNLYLRTMPESDEAFDYEEFAWFGTDKDGWFFAVAEEPEVFDDVANNKHSLVFDGDYYYSDGDSQWVHNANTPTKRGRVWDFGEITVAGNLVQVEISGIRDNLEYDIYFEFTSGSMWQEADIPSAGGFMLMQAGRYRWTCDISSSDVLYEDVRGMLDVSNDQHTKLIVEFVEIPTVKVTVKLNKEKSDGNNYDYFWIEYNLRNDDTVRYSRHEDAQTALIPVIESHIEIRVGGKGYHTQKLSIQKNSPPVNIVLLPIKQILVTVHLPALPNGFKLQAMKVIINVYKKHKASWFRVVEAKINTHLTEKEGFSPTYLLDTGKYRFVLTGGKEWGYGQLGQKELEITSSDGNVVVFDSIPEAPWEFRSGGIRTKAYVADRIVNITAQAHKKDGKSLTVNINSDNASSNTRQISILPIIDGDQFIKPVETPPAKDGGISNIRVDLPHRISVTCSERGERVSVFSVEASFDNRHERCSSKVQKGIGKLWLPPGKAWLSVELNNRSERREIEVISGRVIDIHIDFVDCKVTFSNTLNDDDVFWELHIVEKNGSLTLIGWARPNVPNYLKPGKYTVVSHGGFGRREFEVTASDVEIEVELPIPKLKLQKGDLLLNLDMPIDTSVEELEFTVEWTAITGDPKLDQSYGRQSFNLDVIETPEGLLLKGVPLGLKICIFGGFDTWSKDKEKAWLLKPIVVNLTRSGETQTTKLVTVVEDGEGWWKHGRRILSYADGLPIYSWFGLPVGRHKFGFYKDGILVLSEWITIPTGIESFDLPESVQTKLDALTTKD